MPPAIWNCSSRDVRRWCDPEAKLR